MKHSWWFRLLLFLVFLPGCGEGLPSWSFLPTFMRSTFPATKYFTGDLLPLAQRIEADDVTGLDRRLTFGNYHVYRNVEQDGMTLLLYAMMNRRKECMKVLLKHKIDPNQNTLLGENELQIQPVGIAAGGEDTEILTILLDHGGDPNSRYNNEPALFAAIKQDRYDHMRLLLDRNADINSTDKYGRTPVMALADHSQFDQVTYLIKRGADINKPDNHGATLAFAVQDNDFAPGGESYQQQRMVMSLMAQRGVKFPVPHPGIAFQAKVKQENIRRRQCEQTPEGEQWLERMGAATQSRAPGAANEAMRLRQQAEPVFQAWRKTQPVWFPTTNDGSIPLYNSPLDRDLAPQAADSVR